MNWFSSFLSSIVGFFYKKDSNSNIVAEVQAATVKLCGFLPVAESVSALVTATNPTIAPSIAAADAIAKQICSVVAAKPAAWTTTPVSDTSQWIVDGIPVQGRWVR